MLSLLHLHPGNVQRLVKLKSMMFSCAGANGVLAVWRRGLLPLPDKTYSVLVLLRSMTFGKTHPEVWGQFVVILLFWWTWWGDHMARDCPEGDKMGKSKGKAWTDVIEEMYHPLAVNLTYLMYLMIVEVLATFVSAFILQRKLCCSCI